MMKRDDARIEAVRRFSRFYTQRIGLLSEGILESAYSLSEARVIYELAQRDVTTGTDIASELGLDGGYVSRILRSLERRGLISKSRSDEDRRRIHLRLSARGRQEFERLNSGSRAQIGSLLEGLGETGADEVVDAMRAIEKLLGDEPAPRNVTYRPHAPGDLGWIVQRHAELYHASHGYDQSFEALVADIVAKFVTTYDPSYERCWIAEVDGRRAGSIALVRHAKTIGQLRLLLVEPWARGLGVGKRLVSECVGHARHVGYESMVLFTVHGLDAARRLYESEGFELVEEKPQHEWGQDALAQTWELEL